MRYYVKRSKSLDYLLSVVASLHMTINKKTGELLTTFLVYQPTRVGGYFKLCVGPNPTRKDETFRARADVTNLQLYKRCDWSILGEPYDG